MMQSITSTASAPFFSFEDAGIRRAIVEFASDWGDAQAAEDYHAGAILDADDVNAEGYTQARAVLAEGSARTDNPRTFETVFADAWSDAYAARIVFAEMRGW